MNNFKKICVCIGTPSESYIWDGSIYVEELDASYPFEYLIPAAGTLFFQSGIYSTSPTFCKYNLCNDDQIWVHIVPFSQQNFFLSLVLVDLLHGN